MATSPDHSDATTAASLAGTPEGWGWALASGIVLLLAGLFALADPGATTVAVTFFLGWLLVVAGIAGIIMGIRTRRAHQRWIDLLYGAVSLLVGIVVLINPLAGALSLTLAFAFWLAFRGAVELGGASRSHGHVRTGLVVTGAINIILALLMILYFPLSVQVLGIFVGISFLIGGIVTILAAIQLRRLASG